MSSIDTTDIDTEEEELESKTNYNNEHIETTQNNNHKYQEIISLNPIEFQLNLNQITEYILDLEYNINPKHNGIDPCTTLRNVNFIISCYIWYYIRDDENWEFIQSFDDETNKLAIKSLIDSNYKYKSDHYEEQQPGFINTIQRIPKSLFIGGAIGIVSTFGAASLCVGGTIKLININIENGVKIYQERTSCDTKDTLYKLPSIPITLAASIVIGGIVGATTLIAIPCVTLGSAGLYLCNGTDLTDIETWQYIGKTKFGIEPNGDPSSDNNEDNDLVVIN